MNNNRNHTRRRGSRRNQMNRGKRNPNITERVVNRLLSDGPSYQGQQYEIINLPCTTSLLTTTVTTGVIAFEQDVTLGMVTNLTRFSNAWDEYRIIKCRYKVYAAGVSTGVTTFWFDEKSNATPTANESFGRDNVILSNNSSNAQTWKRTLTWEPRDLFDLEYVPINNTTNNCVYFKAYTSSAVWNSGTAATVMWIIHPILTVEFRGLRAL